MKLKSVVLQDVQITYDPSTGGIAITSKDPAIKGKPFQVKLYSDTSSYDTLLELLKKEGAHTAESVNIATKLVFDSPAETFVPNSDPRVHIRIGETFNGAPLDLDLFSCPHYLMSGVTGSGKSILQRNIAAHALASDNVELWGIDLKRVELSPYFPNGSKRFARTVDEAFALTEKLLAELEDRLKLLELKAVNNYLDTTLKAIYLMVDEVWPLFGKEPEGSSDEKIRAAKKAIIQERLKLIARKGRAAGVHLFLGSLKLDNEIPGELKANLGGRILLGRLEPRFVESVLGRKARYGGELLRPHGRALVYVHGQQTLAQIAFMEQGAATL